MAGQGRPRTSHDATRSSCATGANVGWLCALVWCAVVSGTIASLSPAHAETMRLRVAWGGGAERIWHGSIGLSGGKLSDPRPLGIEADEPGSMWLTDGQLRIASRSLRAYDGVDLEVDAPLTAKLLIKLTPTDAPGEHQSIEVPLATLVSEFHQSTLDNRENRLLVRRTPGDQVRVTIDASHSSQVFAPSELFKLQLKPHLLGLPDGTNVKLHVQLLAARDAASQWTGEYEVTLGGNSATAEVEVPLPAVEGVYDLAIQARIRTRLRLMQTVAQRKLQLIVIEPSLVPAALASDQSLVQLTEIDPVEPINPNWWNRLPALPNIPLIPNWRKSPLGSGEAHTWQHPQLRQTLVQLGLGGREPDISWEAYPLPIDRPGEPHVLEIDYPSDVPQSLGISIIEPNAAGTVLPIGLDSGVYVPDEAADTTAEWHKHRLIFWPRTRSPLVLLTNRRDGSPAVFGKMRLMGGPPRLPRAYPRDDVPGRLWAGYLDRPLFAENFLGAESLDSASGRSLDDWTTFYQGGTRLVDYLNHVGYNGLMLAVMAEGSTIYPSKVLQSTPHYDTGVFFGDGQDAQRKDVLELMFRLFDREGLRLIPSLQFAAPLPELEQLRRKAGPESVGLELVDAKGRPWLDSHPPKRGLAPHYNLLHPAVQEAMLRVCDEVISRYKKHPAFGGLAIDLTADGFGLLPGPDCGYDDVTIARFQKEHPDLQVPGGTNRFVERAQFLMGPARKQWLAWRATQVKQFYHRLNERLREAVPQAQLYLAGGDLFSSRQMRRELRPALPRTTHLDEALLNRGIHPTLGEQPGGPMLLRPNRIAPPTSLDSHAQDLEINLSTDLDLASQRGAVAGSLLYHPPQEVRLESFDRIGPFKNSYTWLVGQLSPSQAGNRQRFAHALATLDPQAMFDGGRLLPLGQEAALASLIAAYRQLPAQTLQPLSESQPVVMRAGAVGDRTCFYAVNDSPWKVTARVDLTLPAGCTFEPLDKSRSGLKLSRDARTAQLTMELEPYDLLGGWFSAPQIVFARPRVELPAEVPGQLEARLSDLSARSSALSYAQPLPALPLNAGFEEPVVNEGTIPGWSAATQAGTVAGVDSAHQLSGKHSVRLASTGPEAWIRSEPIPPPRTGRLAVSAWLRVNDPARQPPLRLAAEWQHEGQIEYRYAALGQPMGGVVPQSIPAQWQLFVFIVPDLPVEGVSELRVRLDLMGPGEVWIDDVQLFDMVFGERERVALVKLISLNSEALRDGKYADCQRFLDSYWPRFLAMHVPLVNDPQSPTERGGRVAQPERKPDDPPVEEARKPGFIDRIKGMVPNRLWF